jgi:hypothetical protein
MQRTKNRGFRPGVEALESRWVPSTVTGHHGLMPT